MKKTNSKKPLTSSALPLAPIIYVNDPQLDTPNANSITAIIPVSNYINYRLEPHDQLVSLLNTASTFDEAPTVIIDTKNDDQNNDKLKAAVDLRDHAINHGCNFVSINLYLYTPSTAAELIKWGTNHLDLNIANLSQKEVAERIYKWLFTVLSIPETLHLISDREMRTIDKKSFPDYEYCPISESRLRSKDTKIQFVVLITSKPVVGPGQKLTWTVADRTGVANFYFQHRGPESTYTWNWVLNLKLGERRALPRMPCIKVVESVPRRILKAPFRATAAVVIGTGSVIKSVGHGLGKVGNKVKMGDSKEWVPEADVKCVNGRYVKVAANGEEKGVRVEAKKAEREIKVFNDKGVRLWGDEDWDACTEKGSILDEKVL